jgi:hypothetical protein
MNNIAFNIQGNIVRGYIPPPDRPVAAVNRSFPTITSGRNRHRFFARPALGLAPLPVAWPTPGGFAALPIRAPAPEVGNGWKAPPP